MTQPRKTQPVKIIAFGVSTGGPSALTQIFRELPDDLPIPLVLVQHMPPLFTKCLAQRLDSVSPVHVREAEEGEVVLPSRALVAPGNFHMTLALRPQGVTIRLHQGPPENSCRPSVDTLFRSVAELYGPAALAVVLTGMGHDGLRGCEAIRAAGGRVIVQNEATSVVWGMAGAVASANLADQVLPLDEIAAELIRLSGERRRRTPPLAAPIEP